MLRHVSNDKLQAWGAMLPRTVGQHWNDVAPTSCSWTLVTDSLRAFLSSSQNHIVDKKDTFPKDPSVLFLVRSPIPYCFTTL